MSKEGIKKDFIKWLKDNYDKSIRESDVSVDADGIVVYEEKGKVFFEFDGFEGFKRQFRYVGYKEW